MEHTHQPNPENPKIRKIGVLTILAILALAMAFVLTSCAEDPANKDGYVDGGDNNGDNGNNGNNNGGSNVAISELTIKNSTGYYLTYFYIKPSTSTDWGSDLLGYSGLSDGESQKVTFSKPLTANNKYDIWLGTNSLTSSSGNRNTFIKYNVSVSNGTTITFTTSDLNDESNLPSITIQNRTGISFNDIYIRPSSMPSESQDWGMDYGSLSNNGNRSITIPIPPSSYKTFDIKMSSSNPANTYTKKNVTISDGMVIKYTSTDSDNPFTGSPFIVIHNSTGYYLPYLYIKPSTSTDWGSDLLGYSGLSDGESHKLNLPQSLSDNSEYDIWLGTNSLTSSSGNKFIKYKFTVSNGMDVVFTTSDLNDEKDLPSITIQNRTGVSFNSIYVKPSGTSDWGSNYSSLSNNSDKSISIPIPPSSYTTFDIQMRSTNPTNTYTRNNVEVSNGMVLTYTSADSDNSLIGSPVIVIENNTGYSISYIYVKPSASTDWGTDLLGYSSLADSKSQTFTVSQSLSSSIDIRLGTSATVTSGNQFIKSNVSLSQGMIVKLSASDLQY